MNPLINSLLASAKTSELSDAAAKTDQVSSVDYTDTLMQISQMVAYCDLILLLIAVLIFFGMGMFFGYLVTRWMRGS